MDTIGNYKNRALASLKGKWDKAVIATLIFAVVYQGVSMLLSALLGKDAGNVFSLLWIFVTIPLMWGYYVYFLRLEREESLEYARIFDGYKGDWLRIFTTYLLYIVYLLLWTLLFIVPGIIKSISYAMVPYILKDDPGISNNAAIEKSMRMMDGHKMEYFLLALSFIGWMILSVLTFGVGLLLLYPYMTTTMAHYYEDLKAEQEQEYEG